MDPLLSHKQELVFKWLQDIFADEPVPSFNQSITFICHLYELITHELDVQRKFTAHSEFIATCVKDYNEDLDRAVSTVHRLGLSHCVTSPDNATTNLAFIASDLSLSALDDSAYLLALTDLLLNKEETAGQVQSLNKRMYEERQELTDAIKLSAQLDCLLSKVSERQAEDESAMKGLSRETEFLQNKVVKYEADQRKQERRVSHAGVSRNLTHSKLVSDFNELQEFTGQTERTKSELAKFADLPPDIDLARVRLEVAKSELRDLEDALAKQIDISHL